MRVVTNWFLAVGVVTNNIFIVRVVTKRSSGCEGSDKSDTEGGVRTEDQF